MWQTVVLHSGTSRPMFVSRAELNLKSKTLGVHVAGPCPIFTRAIPEVARLQPLSTTI